MYLQKLKSIYRNAWSWIITLLVFFAFLSLIVILQNLELIQVVSNSGTLSIAQKIKTLLSLYGSLESNASTFSLVSTLILGILFAIHIVVFIKVIKERKKLAGATGVLGMLTGLFGVGCAACGSLLITGVFATGAGVLLTALPFSGVEFSILGIILLVISLRKLLKQYQEPVVCSVDNE